MKATTRVGEFFLLGEFTDRRQAQLPPGTSPVALARLCCVVLDPVRRRFGPTFINSGHRTPTTNQLVGGATSSRHLYNQFPETPAADFRCATGTPRDWYRFVDEILKNSGGLGLYASHVHVDRRQGRSRWSG